MRILVIDDDRFIQLLLKRVIEALSPTYIVEVADELLEASIILESEEFDLLFLDLTFPRTTIEQVYRFIRKHRDLGIVVLTAHEEEEFVYPSLKSGAFDYICKAQLNRDQLKRILGYAHEREEE